MSESSSHASEAWPESDDENDQRMTGEIERFIDAWERADDNGPPDIINYLCLEASIRQELLIELIKVDLEMRWREFSLPKRLSEYCEEFEELQKETLPVELIYEEYFCRKAAETSVTLGEYLETYPQQAEALKQFVNQASLRGETLIRSPGGFSTIKEIEAGQVIDDFDLLMPLGQGAFAKVFLARQISMQRLVAVKISEDHGNEPQTLAQLDHDYIVRVYDQRIVDVPPSRLLYMQYLPGGTLESVTKRVRYTPINLRDGELLLDVLDQTLEEKGEISPTDSSLRKELAKKSWPEIVAWLGIRIAKALGYANDHGVLHRDLKPANVLLSGEGVPKLADFNISFSSSVSGANPTAYFGGSLVYMSPEQLEACVPQYSTQPEDLDGRSDLYSLGVLLWELLTGSRPFDDTLGAGFPSEAIEEMLQQRRDGLSNEKLEFARDHCQESLLRVLSKSLANNRDDRWQNADELVEQLETCLEPRARELIDPPVRSWRGQGRCCIILTVLLLNLIPNAISAVGNFFYNQTVIFEKLAPGQTFEILLAAINGIAFPIGIGMVVWLALQIKRAIHRPDKTDESLLIRESTLMLGHRCAIICLVLWMIAGIAYPVAFQLIGISVPLTSYVHIFGSLLLFGLISTAYPFFGITWYAVQVLYPALLQLGLGQSEDRQYLQKLKSYLRMYLNAAACIPMLLFAALTIFSAELRWLALVLCLCGVVAYLAAFWFYRQIEDDLDVFLRISHSER